MYRSILVPLDGSSFAEQTLPLALRLARSSGAGVQLVQVHVPLEATVAGAALAWDQKLDDALRQREKAYLEQVQRRLAQLSPVPLTTALLEGSIADALEERARATGADLVVMSTHGRGPLARSWLGSVADALVRRLPMPLLLVRPPNGKADLAKVPAVRHILIALDGSEFSERILEPALALGSLVGASFTLLRVVRPTVLGQDEAGALKASGDLWLVEQLEKVHEKEQAQAKDYLEKVAERLRGRALQVQTRVLSHDQPALAILEEVKARQADLIALETHGRKGWQRLFLGSVADKVVRAAPVPILIAHPPTKENSDG